MVMNWQELSRLPPQSIVDWAEGEPWARAMQHCLQDAQWHAEGDVWTHTRLVSDELYALDEWSSLDKREQCILLMTALFHDAAKPLTTTVDPLTGHTTSPKHAIKGEHLARQVLRELGCELVLREDIARMVRYHGRPAFLLERQEPAHEVIRLSWLVANRLLYLFAIADTRGRVTKEMSRPEENLHFWKMLAEEYDCLQRPYAFANPQARFGFLRQTQSNLFYVPHEAYSCTVTMVSGLPGSGKDRWLRDHRPGLPMVSLDEVRLELRIDAEENQGAVVQAARERCREFLRRGESFAFNATNLLVQTRSRWIELFVDYRAHVEIVYLEPALATIHQQNKERDEPVPQAVIDRLAAKVEVPTWMECHSLELLDRAE
jgi:predicted kinase